MNITPIKQPNNWTCLAACCCMITGKSLDDFYKAVGHDGSGKDPDSPLPGKQIGFFTWEAFQFLAKHRYFPTACVNGKVAKYMVKSTEISIIFNPIDPEQCFIINVESQRFTNSSHAILMHKGVVHDPNRFVKGNPKLSKYKVHHVIPVRYV